MTIQVRDEPVPNHWSLLQKIIARDSQLRPDVTMIVDGKSIRVVDARGKEIHTPTPLILRDADLTQRAEQIELLVWIWWNFGPEPVQKKPPLNEPSARLAPPTARPIPPPSLSPGPVLRTTGVITGAWAQRV